MFEYTILQVAGSTMSKLGSDFDCIPDAPADWSVDRYPALCKIMARGLSDADIAKPRREKSCLRAMAAL